MRTGDRQQFIACMQRALPGENRDLFTLIQNVGGMLQILLRGEPGTLREHPARDIVFNVTLGRYPTFHRQ